MVVKPFFVLVWVSSDVLVMVAVLIIEVTE